MSVKTLRIGLSNLSEVILTAAVCSAALCIRLRSIPRDWSAASVLSLYPHMSYNLIELCNNFL